MHKIHQWSEIKKHFNDTIIIGNGGSIAIDSRFSYDSLKNHAFKNKLFTENVTKLFEHFKTSDFELILRLVWQANNVNKSLNISDKMTGKAYLQVRECLIKTVRDIHPEFNDIKGKLPAIYGFLKNFKTVLSLNYDLILYWVIMYGKEQDDFHSFKDCFIYSHFDDNRQKFKKLKDGDKTTSLVFYPHGNLMLARDIVETEIKLKSKSIGLLANILNEWESEAVVPLFVSEGSSKQKISSIHNSYYLNTVYREVLSEPKDSLAIYGWHLGGNDSHIVDKIFCNYHNNRKIEKIAISVFNDDQQYCNRVSSIMTSKPFLKTTKIFFFDSQSPQCWNNI